MTVENYIHTKPEALRKCYDKLLKRLTHIARTFESIAFCGVSGALIAPAIAIALNKGVIVVRKPKEHSHSTYGIEGTIKGKKRYIIIDDFIDSGKTCKTIIDSIKHKKQFHTSTCVGIYTYGSQYNASCSKEEILQLHMPISFARKKVIKYN